MKYHQNPLSCWSKFLRTSYKHYNFLLHNCFPDIAKRTSAKNGPIKMITLHKLQTEKTIKQLFKNNKKHDIE